MLLWNRLCGNVARLWWFNQAAVTRCVVCGPISSAASWDEPLGQKRQERSGMIERWREKRRCDIRLGHSIYLNIYISLIPSVKVAIEKREEKTVAVTQGLEDDGHQCESSYSSYYIVGRFAVSSCSCHQVIGQMILCVFRRDGRRREKERKGSKCSVYGFKKETDRKRVAWRE